MLNTDKGFELIVLPIEAQEFPMLSCLSMDINGDNYDDLILAGNIYQTEVETPRLDSGKGLVLISDGDKNYSPMTKTESGLNIPGDIKSMKQLDMESSPNIVVAGKNQSLLQIIEILL